MGFLFTMKWLNIEIETLRGSEFLGAEPVERATWLSLLGWCSAQENDGIIPDCSEWGSRKWQQLCGVTKEEVDMKSELYTYDGESLIVHFYPITQQAAVKAKREAVGPDLVAIPQNVWRDIVCTNFDRRRYRYSHDV